MNIHLVYFFLTICLVNFSLLFPDQRKIHAHVFKDNVDVGLAAAQTIKGHIATIEKQRGQFVAVLNASKTSLECYNALIALWKKKQIDFSNVKVFSLIEYIGLDKNHPKSTYYFLNRNFYSLISNRLTKEKLSSYGLRTLQIEELTDNLLKRFSLDQINEAILHFKYELIEEYNKVQNSSYQQCEKIYWNVLNKLKKKDEIYVQLDAHIFTHKVLPTSRIFISSICEDLSLRPFGLKKENIYFPQNSNSQFFDPEKAAKLYKEQFEKFSKDTNSAVFFLLNIGKDFAHLGYNSFSCEEAFQDPKLSEEEKNKLALNTSIRVVPIKETTQMCNSVFFDYDIEKTPKNAIVFGLSEILNSYDSIVLAQGLSKQNSLYETFSTQNPTYQIPASLLNCSKKNSPCFYIDEVAYGSGANSQTNLRSFYQDCSIKDPSFFNIYYHNTSSKTLFDIPNMKKPAVALNPFSETIGDTVNLVTLPKKKTILFVTKSSKNTFHFVELLKLKQNKIETISYKNTQGVTKAIIQLKPDIVFLPSDLRKSKRFIPTVKNLLSKEKYQKPIIGIYYSNKRKTNDSVLALSEEDLTKKADALEKYHVSQLRRKDFTSIVNSLANYYSFKQKGQQCPNENYEIYRMTKKNDEFFCKRLSKQLITIKNESSLPKGFTELKLTPSDKIIAVSPHPEDVEIAMGGLLQNCYKAKITPIVANATTGHRVRIQKQDLKSLSNLVPERLENTSSYNNFDEIKDIKYKGMIREFESMNALKYLNPLTVFESLRLPFYTNGMITLKDKELSLKFLEKHASEHEGRIFLFLPRKDDEHPTHQKTTELFYSTIKEFLDIYPEKEVYIAFYRTAWTGYWNLYHFNSHLGNKMAAYVGSEILVGIGEKNLSTTSLGGEFAERFYVFDILKEIKK